MPGVLNKQGQADVKLLLGAQAQGCFEQPNIPQVVREALDRHLQTCQSQIELKRAQQRLCDAVNKVRRGWRTNNTRIAAEYLTLVQSGKWPDLSYRELIKQCRKCQLGKFLLLVQKEHGIVLE